MTMTNPPPVAPVEGHYAMLRNGMVARPILDDWPENPPYFDAYLEIYWYRDGTAQPATSADLDVRSAPLYDIIATISPADMQSVADGELERLRAERADLIAACDEALNWADANARWFDISTAPRGQWLLTYRTGDKRATMAQLGFGDEWISPSGHTTVTSHAYLPPTHWRPLPPPPSNPPLPAPLETLGAVLRRVKGVE